MSTDNEEEGAFEGKCIECVGTGKKDGETCKVCGGKGMAVFKMASQQAVDYLHYYVDLVMKAVEKGAGIKGAWTSDLSSIGDFTGDDEELKKIEDELGMPVHYTDLIVDLARRLKDA